MEARGLPTLPSERQESKSRARERKTGGSAKCGRDWRVELAHYRQHNCITDLICQALTGHPVRDIERGKTKGGVVGRRSDDVGPHNGPLSQMIEAIVEDGAYTSTIIPYAQRDHTLEELNRRREPLQLAAAA